MRPMYGVDDEASQAPDSRAKQRHHGFPPANRSATTAYRPGKDQDDGVQFLILGIIVHDFEPSLTYRREIDRYSPTLLTFSEGFQVDRSPRDIAPASQGTDAVFDSVQDGLRREDALWGLGKGVFHDGAADSLVQVHQKPAFHDHVDTLFEELGSLIRHQSGQRWKEPKVIESREASLYITSSDSLGLPKSLEDRIGEPADADHLRSSIDTTHRLSPVHFFDGT